MGATLFLVFPFAYMASVIWSFLSVKKIRTVYVPTTKSQLITLEIMKIGMLFTNTVLFAILGMLMAGIIGLPLLLLAIIAGMIFSIRHYRLKRQAPTKESRRKLLYNLCLVIGIPVLLMGALAFAVITGQ
ncbi:MAG: hypothetical protein JXK07_14110 [Spirochaetes bacterium]|nr:hypothetical protein [Spirochaetota bacterium]MBN2770131.1 hypothetical protein [Spirochaetota bacterium]